MVKPGNIITHNLCFEKMLVLMYQGNDRWAVNLNDNICFMGSDELRELANKILEVVNGEKNDASEAN